MSTEALEEALRELHGHGEDAPASLEGERAALAAFEEKFGASASKSSGRRGLRGWTRIAAAAASLAVIVGACSMPASYDVKLGVGLRVSFDPAQELPFESMARYAKDELGATDINVAVHIFEEDQGTASIRLWGQDLPPDVVIDQLRADFPELEPLEIDYEILEGKIDTNLGGKLFHQVFDPAIAEEDLELAREQLLVELLAAGMDGGEVDVEVREVDGRREIRVGVMKTEEEALESPLIKELVGHEHTRTQIHRIEVSETGAEVEEEMRMESRRIHIREDD